MRGRRHEVGVRNRGRVSAAGDETRDVGHVDEHDAADLIADFADALEVDRARIGGGTREEDLGLHLHRLLLEGVVIEALGLLVDHVRHDVVDLAGEVDGRTVGEVTTLVERKRENRVTGLDRGEVDRHVRGAAAVWLHVRMVRAEQLAGALTGELLGGVDRQTARVPALPRIAFGILVHQHGPGGEADGAARGVLGRDEVDLGILLDDLRLDGGVDFGIGLGETTEVAQALRTLELGTAARVAAGVVDLRRGERLEDLEGGRRLRAVLAEAEHVRAVVGAGQRGVLLVAAERGAHTLELVGGHRHAHAGRAHEHAEIGLAEGDRLGDGVGVVGIVTGVGGLRTEVQEFRILVLGDDRLLQF